MKKLKKYEDYKELNYHELSFFKGMPVGEAKVFIGAYLGVKEFTKAGAPKVTVKDKIPVEAVNFEVVSHSEKYEGKNIMQLTCDSYNKGVSLGLLHQFAQEKAWIKAIAFTGRYSPANDILDREQYRKLQESWLDANLATEGGRYVSKNAEDFCNKNDWAKGKIKYYYEV